MTITAETLRFYDKLRTLQPNMAPEAAFSLAQEMTAVEVPKLDQLVAETVAKQRKKKTYTQRMIRWTDAAREYVIQAERAGIGCDHIAKNLESHFGLKNVTPSRVRIMIYNLTVGRTPSPGIDQVRVPGGWAGL